MKPRQDIGYHVHYTTSGRRFLVTEDGEDSAAGPSQCTYLVESSAEASAEHSRRLATLMTKNKTKTLGKRSVHRRSQESKKRARKSSTVESTYWRFFTSQVFRLTLHITIVLYCSLDSYKTSNAWHRRRAPYPRMVFGVARGIILMRTPSKVRQSKIALNQTLTLKLGVTPGPNCNPGLWFH